MSATRLTVFLLLGLVVGAVVVMATAREPVTWNGTHLSPPMPAAELTLESADGPVSVSDFRGRAVALFFGYTSCPDVCPTTLLRLSRALDALGEERSDVQVIFISVDPERDSPARASTYAEAVDSGFIGLSGSPEAIAEVAARYGIYYARAEGSDATGYLVDHSATITVLNRNGRVELLWSPTVTAEEMAEDLEALL